MICRFATPKRAAWVCALALVGAGLPASAGAAPSPEDVRACVEGNLARYSDPSTAVGAQYSDIETTCRAGLEDGSISVQLDPAASSDPQAAAAGEAGTTTSGTDGATAATTPATGSAGNTPAAGDPTAGATSEPIAADAASEQLVAKAIAEGDAGAASPLPSSLSGGSAWMIVLLAGAAVAVIGAAALAVRRRLS